MEPTTLVLVRHAHTNANEHGATPMMAGWAEIPISDFGERQLEVVRARFPRDGAGPVVYSSTSERARRTAEAVGPDREIIALRGLREISCGIVDGRLVSDVKKEFPDLWRANAAQNDPDFAWPDGESYRHFRHRVLQTLGGIATRHEGQTVIAVTHAGVVSQTIGHIRGANPAVWEQWRPGNCSVTVIEWDAAGPRLVKFDDRSHLGPLSAVPRQRGG